MKKLMISMCCLALLSTSCGSDDDGDDGLSCSEATQNTVTALTNFTNSESEPGSYEDLCNAYKLALQQQKEACGDSSGTIQSIIDGLGDCVDDVSTNEENN
ncbi:hypothetical protein [Psychroserpens algicola]|uniref:Lipoprotein n=1 Tax=Psychroserpens algicola TaxID=1719034 RepID=A0ABT0HCP7_9FLAO|nr:hypothetical protein [Psychroserpens algicola]MCK8482126.1 hypothetical protein [Psychroserpens algicola]